MDEIRYLLLGLILHLMVISESRVIVPRDLSDDRLSIDEDIPIILNPLEKDKKCNLKRPIRNPPTEDDDYNLYDNEGVNDHHRPPSDSDYNEFDSDINKIDNNLPGTKPERFPFDANDEELEGKPLGKDNRDKPSDDDLKKTFGNEDSDISGNNDKDLESSFDEDKPILKDGDEEIRDIDSKEHPDEDYGNKEHKPENEEKPGEERKDEEENPEPEDEEKPGDERKDEEKPGDERKDEEENPEPEDEEKPGDERKDENEDHKPEDKEKPGEDNEDEERKQEPEDVEKPDEEKKNEEEEFESENEEKNDETKGDDGDDEEKNVPEESIDDENKEEEVPKGIDEESLDEEDDNNINKGIHEGGEAGLFSGGSVFDTPFFNLEQVKKYFSKLDRALGHVFRQTLDEANLLNGTYANTTEEEVEIDGKKYIVTKSVIKGSDNHSSLYVESLSTKPKDTEIIKDIEIRNVSHT